MMLKLWSDRRRGLRAWRLACLLGSLSFFLVSCSLVPEAEPLETSPSRLASEVTEAPPIGPTKEAMKEYRELQLKDGTSIVYAVVLPAGYEAGRQAPILLAFPPGPQTRDMVEAGLNGYWQSAAQSRGWIVISPVAPNGRLFFRGSEAVIPELLDAVEQEYPPEGGRFHVAGVSNGGISAFRVALEQPERIHSLTALPGMPGTQADMDRLSQISHLPVNMFVGELDSDWVGRMQQTESELNQLGADVSLEVVAGEGHVIQSLTGDRLFDILDANR